MVVSPFDSGTEADSAANVDSQPGTDTVKFITPAMTVLEQVPHLPLLPEADWPVVLCLLGSQCPSATPSSWRQGYAAV